jgi:hypothetical protein
MACRVDRQLMPNAGLATFELEGSGGLRFRFRPVMVLVFSGGKSCQASRSPSPKAADATADVTRFGSLH